MIFRRKGLSSIFSVTTAAVALLVAQAHGQNLSDGNSSLTVNATSQSGVSNWTVDGHNYLDQQWFWYRIGSSGAQHSIDTLTLASDTVSGNELFTTYDGTGFNIQVTYTLNGGTAGSGTSTMQVGVTVNNTGSTALAFNFFQYSHFDLSGGHDSVAVGKNISGLYNDVLQSAPGGMQYEESTITPGANLTETGISPSTLNNLNTVSGYNLNNNASAGPGAVAWALEWQTSIGAGSSFQISKPQSLTVPEPSTLGLLSLGLAAFAFRRSKAA